MVAAVQVRGLKEIEQQLIMLGSKAGTKILRRAMLKATEPIAEHAKQTVAGWEGGSGALHLSIARRFTAGRAKSFFSEFLLPALGGRFNVEIAPRRKNRTAVALHNLFYGRRRKGIFYGHLLEFGHRIGTRSTGWLHKLSGRGKKGGQSLGRVAAKPFLKPALDARGSEAINIMAEELRVGIDRELRKRAKGKR